MEFGKRLSFVERRIATFEQKHYSLTSPDMVTIKAMGGKKSDEQSSTTCTATTVSSTTISGTGKEKPNSISSPKVLDVGTKELEDVRLKKENLLGTCVSFTERDDCSETTSCSHPSGSQSEELEYPELHDEEELEECSEDALVAAIAVATVKRVEEASYAAFFETAAAEAVAAAELTNEECHVTVEEPHETKEEDVEDLVQRIEEQLSSPHFNGDNGRSNPRKNTSVSEVLQDIERVLFFTDVVDRNPTPPAAFNPATALMSPSAMMGWEAKMREVRNAIYQSGVDMYNEIERTGHEVQRVVLFTDVPDYADAPGEAIKENMKCVDIEQDSPQVNLSLAAFTSDSTQTGVPMTTFSEEDKHLPENSFPEAEAHDDMISIERAMAETNKAPGAFSNDLGRLFKGLEQKLLFTDLPDVPLPESGDRSSTASMTLTPTGSGQSTTSIKSALGMCRAQNDMLSQVWKETSNMQQQLPRRAELAKATEIEDRYPEVEVNQLKDPISTGSSDTLLLNSILDKVSEDIIPVLTSPEPSDLSCESRQSASDDTVAKEEQMVISNFLKTTAQPMCKGEQEAASTIPRDGDEETFNHDDSKVVGRPVPSVSADEESEKDAPTANRFTQLLGEYEAPAFIRADSSTDKSCRLLVEVKVNKSRSDSIASSSLVRNDSAQSDISTKHHGKDGETDPEYEEENGMPTSCKRAVKSWTSTDEQKLSKIIGSMGSEQSEEDPGKALSSVLETGLGNVNEDDSKAGSETITWVDCSSSCADTYVTADGNHKRGDSQFPECHNGKQLFLKECARKLGVPEVAEPAGKKYVGTDTNERQGGTGCSPAVISNTDTFDALLAEMKDLETAINSDLKRAHTVLRKTMNEPN